MHPYKKNGFNSILIMWSFVEESEDIRKKYCPVTNEAWITFYIL